MLVRHTSDRYKGQVFVPSVNWTLAIGCAVLVIGFRSSDRLASAYGLAVAFTMLCTSLAYFVVITKVLRWNRVAATALVMCFVLVDGSFIVASLPKFLRRRLHPHRDQRRAGAAQPDLARRPALSGQSVGRTANVPRGRARQAARRHIAAERRVELGVTVAI
jgi:hypothetical protein